MPELALYPPEQMVLMHEIASHHPRILAKLKDARDLADMLCIVAAEEECKILVDGMYNREEQLNLCKVLTDKLKESRMTIWTLTHADREALTNKDGGVK